MAFYT